MSEFTVGHNPRKQLDDRIVSADRLHVVGCIGVWSNMLNRFPLPMYAIDGITKVTRTDRITRVEGLLPSDWDEDHLMEGSWTAQVDIPGSVPHGEGSVYLGNANTPSETWGIVLAQSVAYDPASVLRFVDDPEGHTVLYTRERSGTQQDTSYLVYNAPHSNRDY